MIKINKRNLSIYIIRIVADIILLVTASTIIIGVYRCPIYWLTNIRCPGCGMTRACKAALRLDFKAAYAYNELFPIPFLWVLYEVIRRLFKLGKRVDTVFFSTTCAALVIRWIIITFFI